MTKTEQDPRLLTPGPLTTTARTKEAMLHDWGSRDQKFININKRVRERLLEIAGVSDTHECVPMQGSGTFVVEATLGTLLSRDGKTLVVINGAYGTRMTHMLDKMGRSYVTYETAENEPPNPDDIDKLLTDDDAIDFVTIVHCETTAGILNPIEAVAQVIAKHKRNLIIDSMSAFGAIPLDPAQTPYAAIVFSANKCFEGVPGLGFSIIRRDILEGAAGNAHSLSLDLHDQWKALEAGGQYRFTPPVQVICAFEQALDQFDAEGGVAGRNKRYADNCRILLTACARWALRPCCRITCRRRSSFRFICRPIRSSSSRIFTTQWKRKALFCTQANSPLPTPFVWDASARSMKTI